MMRSETRYLADLIQLSAPRGPGMAQPVAHFSKYPGPIQKRDFLNEMTAKANECGPILT